MSQPPRVSVVVPSHGRPARLRALLDALAGQTLAAELWEVVVCHTYPPAVAAAVLEDHPLSATGRLRHLPVSGPAPGPGAQRNRAWRAALAPYIAFTDDDCRPAPAWLAELLDRARPDVIVQGATRPDPLEAEALRAPHVRTLLIDPVNRFRQTCNILYPRSLLETVDGFDEAAITGEDVDLSLRAEAAGGRLVAAPRAVVFHAIEAYSLPQILVQNLKWRHLAYLVKRHPELRRGMPLRIFWDGEHLRAALALLAALSLTGSGPRRLGGLLAGPWLARALRRRGPGRRAALRCLREAPGQAIRQWAELAGLAWGSVRHRTLVL